uniref:F-box associated domain-containing protein n=1 Tax=Setaria italica TaxID=4555 RepID=K3ZDJ8_SETIT
MSLSNDKYYVIKPPAAGITELYLGKSEKGIYCASFQGRCRLQVWILNESCSQMEWVLKHDRDLLPLLMKNKLKEPLRGPWILQDINNNYKKDVKKKAILRKKFVWSSDASDDDETEYSVANEPKFTFFELK